MKTGRLRPFEMQRTRALVGLAILVGFPIVSTKVRGQTPRFEEFAHLFRPATVKQEKGLAPWSWPTRKTFATRFDRYRVDACSWKVLHANFRLYSGRNKYTWNGEVHLRARELDDVWCIRLIAGKDEDGEALSSLPVLSDPQWHLKKGEWGGKNPLHFKSDDGSTLDLSSVSLEANPHLPADLWAAWVLVATVLEADAPEEDPKVSAGHCSMDGRPLRQAIRFSEEAMRMGRTGRFLRFRLRVMGDHFSRRISSSYGQAALGTRAEGLKAAPIDLDRFFLGLVVSVAAKQPAPTHIGVFRLGRAIADTRRAGPLVPRLRRLVVDPNLDAWNRTRALAVLVYTLAHDPTRKPLSRNTSMTRSPKTVIKVEGLRKLPMPKAARAFLDLL